MVVDKIHTHTQIIKSGYPCHSRFAVLMGKKSHENNYDVINIIMSLCRRNGAVIMKIIFSLIICIPRTIVRESLKIEYYFWTTFW